MQKQGVAI